MLKKSLVVILLSSGKYQKQQQMNLSSFFFCLLVWKLLRKRHFRWNLGKSWKVKEDSFLFLMFPLTPCISLSIVMRSVAFETQAYLKYLLKTWFAKNSNAWSHRCILFLEVFSGKNCPKWQDLKCFCEIK